jgi:hypothetical protein
MGIFSRIFGRKESAEAKAGVASDPPAPAPQGPELAVAPATQPNLQERAEDVTVKGSPKVNPLYRKTFFEVMGRYDWFTEDELKAMYEILAEAGEACIFYNSQCNEAYEKFFANKAGWSWTEAPDVKGLDIPATIQEICAKLKIADLKQILSECQIEVKPKDKKQDLVERIAGLGSVEELSQKFGTLKEIAENINGNNKKSMFDELMLHIGRNASTIETINRYKAMGITRAIWMHRPSAKKPRPSHMAMYMMSFDLNEGLFDPEVGRNILPGELPGCHCSMRPVLPKLPEKD